MTDRACVWSWAAGPAVRALMVEFGARLDFTFVVGGLADACSVAVLAGRLYES